jgi:CRISPR-associated protein Cas1
VKQHLNTLFVTTNPAYLSKEGEAVAVKVEKVVRMRQPLINLGGIVAFGRVGFSPKLAAACAEAGVALSLCSHSGRFLARVVGFTPGNVLLRREQYRRADDPEACRTLARSFVAGKIANARAVLLRQARDRPDRGDRLSPVIKRLGGSLDALPKATNTDTVRGIEGEAASDYFSVLNELTEPCDPGFRYTARSRRPPLDRINALLSFVYALLLTDARAACESVGLDSQVGYLHADRPGRPSLALDLMEELRPFLADRLVISLIRRGQVTAKGFEVTDSGAVRMSDATRKAVIVAYQKRKQRPLDHPFLDEKTTVGLVVHLQARLLARHLRGDLDAYPPFLWK